MATDLSHLKSIREELRAWRVRFNAGQRMKSGDLEAIIEALDRVIPAPSVVDAEEAVAVAKRDLSNATTDSGKADARTRLEAAEKALAAAKAAASAAPSAPFLTDQAQRIAAAEKAVVDANGELRDAITDEGKRAARAKLDTAERALSAAKAAQPQQPPRTQHGDRTEQQRNTQRIADAERAVASAETDLRMASEDERPSAQVRLDTARRDLNAASAAKADEPFRSFPDSDRHG